MLSYLRSRSLSHSIRSPYFTEFPNFIDRDVGNRVELFSNAARKELWTKFQQDRPVPVTLFGRENALVKTKHIYRVEGEIQKDGEEDFRFNVISVEVLDKKQILETKERCSKIMPKRNCQKLFNT